MKRALLFSLVVGLLLSSCRNDSVDLDAELDAELALLLDQLGGVEGQDFFVMPDENNYAAIPQDPNNPITAAKVELGRFLFHESAFGINPRNIIGINTYSCSSCHFAKAGFQANRAQGLAEGGLGFGLAGEGRYVHPLYGPATVDVQPIRTPSTINSAYQVAQLWNGQFGATGPNVGTEASWVPNSPKAVNWFGFEGVESQAIAAIGIHRHFIDKDICDGLSYTEMFNEAFPELGPDERYDSVTAGLAIAAYERTMLANRAPFQRWLKGEKRAMGIEEKQGAVLFFGKAQCGTCHTGPALNNMDFYALGMEDLNGPGIFNSNPTDAAHKGRGGFTGNTEEWYKFKTPQLYNLKDSPFYGHGASFRDLYDVVAYKNRAVKENSIVPDERLSEHFIPLGLSDQEIRQIVAFLEDGLYDPDLDRYAPDALPSGNCFPNNDVFSREDLGCD